jgi:hypothetical protein
MPNYICITCGVQFAATTEPPAHCLICAEERQYINWNGQQWATLEKMRTKYKNVMKSKELGLTGIGTEPSFAIGQRALLIQAPSGNVLWDCISLIDDETVEAIKNRGGLSAIAISHPHFYSSMVEWSHAFGGVPIYLHAADRQWVMRPDPVIVFWEGKTQSIGDGLTLIHCGGHFAGGTVLHWAAGADGQGVLCSGDILQVVSDRRYVSFMYSYPNLIPLSAAVVQGVVKAVEAFPYERIYGAWWGRIVFTDAKRAVAASAERYIRALKGEHSPQ